MDKLQAIFDYQISLIKKFHSIEIDNGYQLAMVSTPLNLNERFAQARVRDLTFRIIEEVAEALDETMMAKKREEYIDVLHFLTELTILLGYTPQDISMAIDPDCHLQAVYELGIRDLDFVADTKDPIISTVLLLKSLGMMCNTLKIKPWKQSEKPTDVELFKRRLRRAWTLLIGTLYLYGLSAEDIYHEYIGKAKINDKRIEEGQ